jgi:hypothetical protein
VGRRLAAIPPCGELTVLLAHEKDAAEVRRLYWIAASIAQPAPCLLAAVLPTARGARRRWPRLEDEMLKARGGRVATGTKPFARRAESSLRPRAAWGNRTPDLFITSEALYRLS